MKQGQAEDLARQLWAIGDYTRIRILNRLPVSDACQQGRNVSALAADLQLSQPTISHHLRVLRQAGLGEAKKGQSNFSCFFRWLTVFLFGPVLDECLGKPKGSGKPKGPLNFNIACF